MMIFNIFFLACATAAGVRATAIMSMYVGLASGSRLCGGAALAPRRSSRGRAVADTVTACWAVSIYALRF